MTEQLMYGLRGTDCPLCKDAWQQVDNLGMELPKLFRFYEFEVVGEPVPSGILATGCEFRASTRGPNKGKPTVPLKNTVATVYIPRKSK